MVEKDKDSTKTDWSILTDTTYSPPELTITTELLGSRIIYEGEFPAGVRGYDETAARLKADRQARYRKTDAGRKSHNESKRLGRMNKRLVNPFVGVDGEGSERDYLLLRAGDHVLYTSRKLRHRECFAFLADLPQGFTYVAYYFDYDVSMMCASMPHNKLIRLLRPAERTSEHGFLFPVDIDGFQIDYRPGKEFKIRREGQSKWVTINDVGSFFQCAFVKALTAWGIGTEEEMSMVKAGKEMRSDFTTMTEEVQKYNAKECELLALLMTKFSSACRGIKYLPRKWQGPGELAASMLTYHDIPKRDELYEKLPRDLLEAGNRAYYGGRFETTAVGVLPYPLYSLDINSAYPDSIRKLPCLLHGQWTYDRTPSSDLYLAHGQFQPDPSLVLFGKLPYLYGFPFRTQNCNIRFPASGMGWYWSPEINMARHQIFKPDQVWSYHSDCDCQPFSWVPELYTMRKEWQKQSDNPLAANMGIALKLALNSLYGKMAQSIGRAPFANPIYASLITSLTRTKLYEMVHTLSGCAESPLARCGNSVFYLATDGLFATNKTDLGVGNKLGDWELDTVDDEILLVQPGLYVGHSKMKTRGIPATKVEEYALDFKMAWDSLYKGGRPDDKDCQVPIPFHQFLGLKQAVHFRRLRDCGSWQDMDRIYSFEWATKRDPARFERCDNYFRTLPRRGLINVETRGYSKDIGKYLENNREWYDQKVWFQNQPEMAFTNTDEFLQLFRIEW